MIHVSIVSLQDNIFEAFEWTQVPRVGEYIILANPTRIVRIGRVVWTADGKTATLMVEATSDRLPVGFPPEPPLT